MVHHHMHVPPLLLQAQPTLVQMGHSKNPGSTQKSCWFPCTAKVGFMVLALCACMVRSEEKIENPLGGSLCISECASCPTICSPPPPSLATSYSNHPPPSPLAPQPHLTPPPPHPTTPSSMSYPPPPPLLTSYPSPPSLLGPSPPLLTSYSPPILLTSYPPPPPLLTYPPPSLVLPPPEKHSQPPPSVSAPPPPPPLKSNNQPSSGSGQPTVVSGPHDYPYPYYYYYSSPASSFSLHVMPFFLLVSFIHGVFF